MEKKFRVGITEEPSISTVYAERAEVSPSGALVFYGEEGTIIKAYANGAWCIVREDS